MNQLVDLIKDIKVCMFMTMNEDGKICGRPMASLQIDPNHFNGTLFFFSLANSQKNHAIENDQHVNLCYADTNHQRYISISGKAKILIDKSLQEKLWEPTLKSWFPKGLADPDLSLIQVEIESAELWNSPPNKVIQLVGKMKSMVTGKTYEQNSKVEHIDFGPQH
ncbi:MAG: pyridoxamine 5'-phosphate oxidase family protein [Bacteriovoracaceae bacterium]